MFELVCTSTCKMFIQIPLFHFNLIQVNSINLKFILFSIFAVAKAKRVVTRAAGVRALRSRHRINRKVKVRRIQLRQYMNYLPRAR